MSERTVKNWRVARGPEKKERIAHALDNFIEELLATIDSPNPSSSLENPNIELEPEIEKQSPKSKSRQA
ncbi:hypothetical protein WA1_08220 [Scytonema hofmannii PCC 7110]|uniref:Uncharacterized protein n=1 Tax=Scytonema hofmannii PCC 7110 TaxID=128403 RepID=A0A139WRT2_9CYAN|nr:hypothetical protein [Scytonema hofmannii]KYC35142.1 hypothetical protein WA1_08220 [Scytonema hofmannii PCC 7110]